MDTNKPVSLHLYGFTSLLTEEQFYLPFKQPECHFIIKQRCQGREYYLKCKQSVKDDCQETAHPERLTATAACYFKMSAGAEVHTGLWFTNCGVHQNHLEAELKHRLIQQVWDEMHKLKFPGVLLCPTHFESTGGQR